MVEHKLSPNAKLHAFLAEHPAVSLSGAPVLIYILTRLIHVSVDTAVPQYIVEANNAVHALERAAAAGTAMKDAFLPITCEELLFAIDAFLEKKVDVVLDEMPAAQSIEMADNIFSTAHQMPDEFTNISKPELDLSIAGQFDLANPIFQGDDMARARTAIRFFTQLVALRVHVLPHLDLSPGQVKGAATNRALKFLENRFIIDGENLPALDFMKNLLYKIYQSRIGSDRFTQTLSLNHVSHNLIKIAAQGTAMEPLLGSIYSEYYKDNRDLMQDRKHILRLTNEIAGPELAAETARFFILFSRTVPMGSPHRTPG